MQITEITKSQIIDIAFQAKRNDFYGLQQITDNIKPDVLIKVDQPDLMGTRTDAFLKNGNLFLTHGEDVYSVGALSSLLALTAVEQPNQAKTSATEKLRSIEKTSKLPETWLIKATKFMHEAESKKGYYDYRVALHGKSAEKLVKAAGFKDNPAFNTDTDVLLVKVYGYDEIKAEVYAQDVTSGSTRRVGRIDHSYFNAVTGWDGSNVPAHFRKAVLLPITAKSWNSGDELAGFENIARFKSSSAIDAIQQKPSQPTILGAIYSFLTSKYGLGFPPIGKRYGATDLFPELEIVKNKSVGGHNGVFSREQAAVIRKWEDDVGFPYAPDSDEEWAETTVTVKPEVSFQTARDYLMAISPEHKESDMAALLLEHPGLKNAQFSLMHMYDTGAEVIGDDVMVITPQGSDKSLVIRINYFHG